MRYWLKVVVITAAVAFAIFAAFHWWIANWFWHPLGYCTGRNCKGYQFWSGIVSDISEVTLIVGVIGFWVHHTCHVGRCWRYGKHNLDGTPFKLCRKHHPDLPDKPLTADDIAAANRN